MSTGPGRWQREALALLDTEPELLFYEIAARLNATTRSQQMALNRALNRLVAIGRLGKRRGRRREVGYRWEIAWFLIRKDNKQAADLLAGQAYANDNVIASE